MRVRALALLLFTACTACGIQPSPVVDAGEPARGFEPGTRLYFVEDGRLKAVTRPGGGALPSVKAVALLLEGTTAGERGRGLTTKIANDVLIRVTDGAFTFEKGPPIRDGDRLVAATGRLPRLAEGQIVCTIAAAEAERLRVPLSEVRVTLPNRRRASCADYTGAP
ncbi:hypothetical protein [Streptosporangium sp. NPDC000396]|uniref:hypothetical protein n=1 Tax=Streptosporangium sp. NPDC000396 TaxID=3366185 RepID=UPI0036BE6F44